MRNLFGGDPYFDNVILLAPFRGNILDYSKNKKVLTLKSNNPGYVTQDGLGLHSDNYYSIFNQTNDFNIGSGDYTIEFYVKLLYLAGGTGWFLSFPSGDSSGLSLNIGDSGGYPLQINPSNWNVTGFPWFSNKFVHVAVTRFKGIQYVFSDGKLLGSRSNSDNITGSATYGLCIGSQYENNQHWSYEPQIMRDLRITRGVARYTSNFIPPVSLPLHGVSRVSHLIPVSTFEAKRPPLLARMTEHGGDPYFNNVVLQLPLRSHMRDESKNLNTVTVNGNTQLLNDATFFDGNRDYLGVPSSSLPSGTETFTIEVWVNISNLANTTTILRGGTGSLEINVQTSGAVVVDVAGFGNIITSSTGAVSALKWTHVAVCRVGTVVTLFVNGKEAGKASSISNLTTISEIFYNSYSSTYDFRGYARDFRVTKGIARYTSNFVPPTSLPTHGVAAAFASRVPTYMKSEYKNTPINKTKKYIGGVIEPPLRSDIIAVTYGNTIIGGLDSSYTTSRNKIGISNSIESTNFSSVQVNSNATLVPANLHIPSTSIQYATIIAEVNCTNRTTPQYQRFGTLGNEGLVLRGQNGDIHIYGYVSGVLREYIYNGGYTLGRHIYAGVYNGTQFKLYKDGSFLADSNTYTGTLSNASTFYLPGSPTGGEYVAGSVLRTACFNRALSLTEINNWAYGQDAQRLFTSTNNIVRTTTAVEPLPTVKVFYINRDLITPIKDIYANKITHHINSESGTIKDIKGNSITINNATVDNTIKPFGKSSMYFNGSNANVNFPGFNFWGNEYTIDGYMYCIAGSGTNINSSGIVCEGQYYWGLGVNSSNQLNLYYWTGVQNNINGGSIPTSKWVHFAISYSSGIISVWIDGVRKIYSSISPNPASGNIYIGGWNSYANAFNGYIKNVRITKAIRYRGFFITSPTYKELMLR